MAPAHIWNSRTPDLLDARKVDAAPPGGLALRPADQGARGRRVRAGRQAQPPPPPLDALVMDVIALGPPPRRQPPDARVRGAGVWRVQEAHQPQLFGRLPPGLIVEPGARPPQQRPLAAHREAWRPPRKPLVVGLNGAVQRLF